MRVHVYLQPPDGEPFQLFHLRAGDAILSANDKVVGRLRWREWNDVDLPDGTRVATISRAAYRWQASHDFEPRDGLRVVYFASHAIDDIVVVDASWQPGDDLGDPQAGWAWDPPKRHEERFWDGSAWTPRVRDGGSESIDDQLPLAKPVQTRE